MATIRRLASGSWQAIVRVKGPEGPIQRKRSFPRKTDARLWAQETAKAIRAGRVGTASHRRLRDLIELWRRNRLHQLKGPLQQRQREAHLAWWDERVGQLRIEQVTTRVVARHLDSLDVAPSTRNRYKSVLGAVYRYAIERGELPRGENPTVGLQEKVRNARTRWLDADERQRLLDAVEGHPDLPLIVRLALTTGMRRGEIQNMRWRDLDFERQLIAIPDTKTGRVRSAPIHPAVRPLLEARRRERGEHTTYVFESRYGRPTFPRKRWAKAIDDAGLDDFRFHDLRHTAASLQARRGASLNELKTLFGHETLEMVLRYAHMVDNEVAHAARERLADLQL